MSEYEYISFMRLFTAFFSSLSRAVYHFESRQFLGAFELPRVDGRSRHGDNVRVRQRHVNGFYKKEIASISNCFTRIPKSMYFVSIGVPIELKSIRMY